MAILYLKIDYNNYIMFLGWWCGVVWVHVRVHMPATFSRVGSFSRSSNIQRCCLATTLYLYARLCMQLVLIPSMLCTLTCSALDSEMVQDISVPRPSTSPVVCPNLKLESVME